MMTIDRLRDGAPDWGVEGAERRARQRQRKAAASARRKSMLAEIRSAALAAARRAASEKGRDGAPLKVRRLTSAEGQAMNLMAVVDAAIGVDMHGHAMPVSLPFISLIHRVGR